MIDDDFPDFDCPTDCVNCGSSIIQCEGGPVCCFECEHED